MSHYPNKYHAFICTQRRPDGHPRGCCTSKGGGQPLFQRLAEKVTEMNLWEKGVSVASSSCLGFCKFGPLMVVYPQGIWYKAETVEDIDEIVSSHFANDKPVERLIVTPSKA
ncbi:Ferredoxin, 2Fe-2S [Magnetospirillum sp. XM-1]|uniref:(2Fe-2S) ferredoxin domain-containing protein n=1 Tax=Magnetospirillum sp. XM-1 TaxID=1663591 RepID=UPI00073DD32A|nr:(2Fe-2S) ferredoxin domain-containing protein [Magnetospirillum sp. XM-1]CUW40228.1 Ferredoxin, 2Fe-2S [Magnetospirillum sp. XM-1]